MILHDVELIAKLTEAVSNLHNVRRALHLYELLDGCEQQVINDAIEELARLESIIAMKPGDT